ncbi:hypothetical protein [Armatimonas rosea]|uniref:Uncharacterized protein n=1 Tax=Armatimonas rosea TaxID=685828 RepID=A0A7W9SP13_ARMRO|nr:hypothetical protein [Armatimonas rosea]MBB6050150.1 hypothetical protein [Armatimonas rosea]
MLLPTPPAFVSLIQAASPKDELTTVVYDLHNVSPAYFLQELDSPRNPRRPDGVASITPDDVRSIIMVKATPAGHTALRAVLEKLDTSAPPQYIHFYLHATKDGEITRGIPLSTEISESLTVGIQYNQAELDEMKKRPWNCQVPVKPEVALIFTPHRDGDDKTIRLEWRLVRSLPKSQTQTVVLPELTLKIGEKTTLPLSDALPSSLSALNMTAWLEPKVAPNSVAASQQANSSIYAETRVQVKKKGELFQAPITAHAKDAPAEFYFEELQAQGQTLGIVAHFSDDEKTARLEYFLRVKDNLQASVISLGTQTVTVGENTKMVLDKPLGLTDADEFYVRVQRVTPDDYLLP